MNKRNRKLIYFTFTIFLSAISIILFSSCEKISQCNQIVAEGQLRSFEFIAQGKFYNNKILFEDGREFSVVASSPLIMPFPLGTKIRIMNDSSQNAVITKNQPETWCIERI